MEDIVKFSEIEIGGYFAVKTRVNSLCTGRSENIDIAFMNLGDNESPMRLFDALRYDPTFGPDSAVRRITEEQAFELRNQNVRDRDLLTAVL